MNYNRLVKRYHIEVKELRPPSSDDVTRRTAERVLDLILKERDGSPDAVALADVLLARDDRRHVVASLLEVWRDEKFQKHLFGGLKWATGELKGDATPTGPKK